MGWLSEIAGLAAQEHGPGHEFLSVDVHHEQATAGNGDFGTPFGAVCPSRRGQSKRAGMFLHGAGYCAE